MPKMHGRSLGGEVGFVNELNVANTLNQIKNVNVFHSVANPDGSIGETDHVVLAGNSLILIETKTYSAYKSFLVDTDNAFIGYKHNHTKGKILSSNRLPQKVAMYSRLLPKLDVTGVIVLPRVVEIESRGTLQALPITKLAEYVSNENSTQLSDDYVLFIKTTLSKYC